MAEQEQKRKDEELLQDLRFELQQEEFDANERRKDREEVEKKQRFKELMIQAEREDIALKQARRAEEERIEAEYKRQMMEKFALDEKLEQMSQQKRRMKEMEFKREVNYKNERNNILG
jgi:3-methyladenine DNA glycosylase/8-oxoguanine DNA glycosylase